MSVYPVTQLESPDAKNTAERTISSGCAMRPVALRFDGFLRVAVEALLRELPWSQPFQD
jgi:hypothetical protein